MGGEAACLNLVASSYRANHYPSAFSGTWQAQTLLHVRIVLQGGLGETATGVVFSPPLFWGLCSDHHEAYNARLSWPDTAGCATPVPRHTTSSLREVSWRISVPEPAMSPFMGCIPAFLGLTPHGPRLPSSRFPAISAFPPSDTWTCWQRQSMLPSWQRETFFPM